MRAKAWFYARGAAMKSRGLPLQLSPLWVSRNSLPLWAYKALTRGYDQNAFSRDGGKQ